MNKRLLVKYLRAKNGGGYIQITYQSHRGDVFGGSDCIFHVGERTMASASVPQMGHLPSIYARGSDHEADFSIMQVSDMDNVLNMVLKYNQTYTKNKLCLEDVAEEIKAKKNFDRMPTGYRPDSIVSRDFVYDTDQEDDDEDEFEHDYYEDDDDEDDDE